MNGVRDLLYVRFSLSDLEAERAFLDDFGLEARIAGDTLLARGTDANAYIYIATRDEDAFQGIGFEADSMAALERIASIDGVPIEPITDLPGGGHRARLTDPDGFDVDIVFGLDPVPPLPIPTRNAFNSGADRPRLGERVVLPESRQIVKRLGHCVINVTDFRESEAWYKERIGFITSDEICLEDDRALGAFFRLNRGAEYVDHHTLFCVGVGEPAFNHAAFEVADWDTLMLGHYRLQAASYQHRWGVGKHLLGSQVFDYWKDPHGFTLEHFTDGDLLNESFGSHTQPIEKLLGTHWGPEGAP